MKAEEPQSPIISNYDLVVSEVSELKRKRDPGGKKEPPAVIKRFLNIKRKSSKKLKWLSRKLTDEAAEKLLNKIGQSER